MPHSVEEAPRTGLTLLLPSLFSRLPTSTRAALFHRALARAWASLRAPPPPPAAAATRRPPQQKGQRSSPCDIAALVAAGRGLWMALLAARATLRRRTRVERAATTAVGRFLRRRRRWRRRRMGSCARWRHFERRAPAFLSAEQRSPRFAECSNRPRGRRSRRWRTRGCRCGRHESVAWLPGCLLFVLSFPLTFGFLLPFLPFSGSLPDALCAERGAGPPGEAARQGGQ